MSFLTEIVESTRSRIPQLPAGEPAVGRVGRNLEQALQGRGGLSVIAEVKRSSPSAGALAVGADAARQANIYAEAGAAAVSMSTSSDVATASVPGTVSNFSLNN